MPKQKKEKQIKLKKYISKPKITSQHDDTFKFKKQTKKSKTIRIKIPEDFYFLL